MFRPAFRVAVLLLFILPVLLSGCGISYTVSVDSLRDDTLAADVKTFVLEPGNEEIRKDDLLFREVCRIVAPAFQAHGYTLVEDRKQADGVARISYWSEAPRQEVRTDYVTRSVPVTVRHGRHSFIDYVYVDEPTLVSYTVYTTRLCIEASTLKGTERQIWRTLYSYSGTRDDFRGMLSNIAPAIPRGLASQTNGTKRLIVEISEDGLVTVTDPEFDR